MPNVVRAGRTAHSGGHRQRENGLFSYGNCERVAYGIGATEQCGSVRSGARWYALVADVTPREAIRRPQQTLTATAVCVSVPSTDRANPETAPDPRHSHAAPHQTGRAPV